MYTANRSSAAAHNTHSRSEGVSAHDLTHQYPQKAPHAPVGISSPLGLPGVSGYLTLARRDATACLSDGTCADGRYVRCLLKNITYCCPGSCSSVRLSASIQSLKTSWADFECFISCCSTSGTCGYGPTYCGLGNVSVPPWQRNLNYFCS